jgi:hypothetical protein
MQLSEMCAQARMRTGKNWLLHESAEPLYSLKKYSSEVCWHWEVITLHFAGSAVVEYRNIVYRWVCRSAVASDIIWKFSSAGMESVF